jgi:hypothetical protein
MFHAVGIDRGREDDREISVNLFSGAPTLGMSTPVTGQYVALPCSGLTFRRMFLPRASKTIRQQVITEELSYSLPFPLTEAHYGAVEMGEEAWVTVASDSVVQPIRDLYPKAHLEAEPLCYLRAAKAAGIQQALVVDFGASKTVFCGVENGQIGTVRVLLRGGEALTEELANEASLSRDEAELKKRDEGTEHPTVRRFLHELLEEALLPSPLPYRRVLICGGGSATHGLLRLLSKIWGDDVDVEPFPLPGMLLPTDHVVAYGAALAGRPKAVRLQMQHSFQHAALSGGKLSIAPLVFTAILMILMVAGIETRLSGAEERRTELRSTLNEALVQVLPEPETLSESEIVKQLRQRLDEQRSTARTSPARVMNTLGQIANAVTSNEKAELFSTIFEDNVLKLEGRATLKQAEDIRTGIEKVLVNTEQVKTRPTGDNLFVFQIEGQLPEP